MLDYLTFKKKCDFTVFFLVFCKVLLNDISINNRNNNKFNNRRFHYKLSMNKKVN